jgi:hypothetical protein
MEADNNGDRVRLYRGIGKPGLNRDVREAIPKLRSAISFWESSMAAASREAEGNERGQEGSLRAASM